MAFFFPIQFAELLRIGTSTRTLFLSYLKLQLVGFMR